MKNNNKVHLFAGPVEFEEKLTASSQESPALVFDDRLDAALFVHQVGGVGRLEPVFQRFLVHGENAQKGQQTTVDRLRARVQAERHRSRHVDVWIERAKWTTEIELT